MYDPDKIVKDPLCLGDVELVGTVYIIGRIPAPTTALTSHYSVVVDVSGESTPLQIVGKELTVNNYRVRFPSAYSQTSNAL